MLNTIRMNEAREKFLINKWIAHEKKTDGHRSFMEKKREKENNFWEIVCSLVRPHKAIYINVINFFFLFWHYFGIKYIKLLQILLHTIAIHLAIRPCWPFLLFFTFCFNILHEVHVIDVTQLYNVILFYLMSVGNVCIFAIVVQYIIVSMPKNEANAAKYNGYKSKFIGVSFFCVYSLFPFSGCYIVVFSTQNVWKL